MTDFSHWKLLVTRTLLAAVRRGELSRDFLQGFLLYHAIEHPDPAPEAPRPETTRTGTDPGSRARTGLDPDELGEAARRELVELLGTPREERHRLLERETGRFGNPFLADELIEESRDAVLRNPDEALQLARLAVAVTHRIEPRIHGTDRQLETLARACAYQANVRRARGDLEEAEEGFAFARCCLGRVGGGDPLVPAEIDGLLASLRASQRRLGEFHELIDRVIARYREHGEGARTAHFLLKKAVYLHYAKRSEEAVDVLEEARALISRDEDAWLCLCAEHQMAWILCDMGRLEAAGEMLEANRDLYERFGRRTWLRRQWVRARVAHGLEEGSEAERLYREARDGFLEQQSGYDAAMVSLDLARLYLEQERSREVRELAEGMLPIFNSHEVHDEAAAALELFRDAVAQETASVDLVRRIAGYLEEARHHPSLPFEGVDG